MEQWKPIDGYEGLYEVSDLGRVRSLPRLVKKWNGWRTVPGRILAGGGVRYRHVLLHKDGVRETQNVHVLVARAFIPNPENKPTVNHKKGTQRWNNAVSNLEWATQPEQMKHAHANHLVKVAKGSNHALAALTEAKVMSMRKWYATGATQQVIADFYGICRQHVSDIVRGLKWKHAKGPIAPNRQAFQRGQASLVAMLVVMAMLLVLASLSVPSFKLLNQIANENSTKTNMTNLLQAEQTYFSTYGSVYPASLSYLSACPAAVAGKVTPTATEACLVSPSLTNGQTINGYEITQTLVDTAAGNTGFLLTAIPQQQGGRVGFCAGSGSESATVSIVDGLLRTGFTSSVPSTLTACMDFPAVNPVAAPATSTPLAATTQTSEVTTPVPLYSGTMLPYTQPLVTINSMSVPAGKYLLLSSTAVVTVSSSNAVMTCGIYANGSLVTSNTVINGNGGTSLSTDINLSSVQTFEGTTTVTVQCQSQNGAQLTMTLSGPADTVPSSTLHAILTQ